MSVAGAEIANVHTVENVLLVGKQGFQGVIEPDNLLPPAFVKDSPFEKVLGCSEPKIIIELAGMQLVQIVFHTTHTMVYAHVVVVQNNQQIVDCAGYIVQPLVS